MERLARPGVVAASTATFLAARSRASGGVTRPVAGVDAVANGRARSRDGSTSSRVEAGTRATLHAVAGDRSERMWAAGDGGALVEWTTGGVALDTGDGLSGAAWGSALGLVAGGNEGVLLRAR